MARSMWNGTLGFGLVSIPVSLFSARAAEKKVSFNQINSKTGNRVRQQRVDDKTRSEVLYEDIVKGYEISPDRYVLVTDEELEAIAPKKTKQIQIIQFCPPEQVPVMSVDKPYYLGAGTGGAKGYQLLADAMYNRGVVAIGRMVMRSVEYLVCLSVLEDRTLLCETMVFADQINDHDGLWIDSTPEILGAERTMADQVVEAMTADLDYQALHDEHRIKVLQLIEAKAAGEAPPTEEEPAEPAADLLAALEASLKAMEGAKV